MKLLFTLSFFLLSFFVSAQSPLYGLRWSGGYVYYLSVDRITGDTTLIDTIPGIISTQEESSFLSLNFSFIGNGTSSTKYLFTLNASNGAVISNPQLTYNVISPMYNCNDGTVYALSLDPSSGVPSLITIDPATGARTIIDSLQEVASIHSGSCAIDPVNGHYVFFGEDTSSAATLRLYSVDLQTGSVVHSPAASSELFSVEFSAADTTLYGMQQYTFPWAVASIDPVTAVCTSICSIPGTYGLVTNSSVIDQQNNYYIIKGIDLNNDVRLNTIDLQNGTVVYNPITLQSAHAYQLPCLEKVSGVDDHGPAAAFALYPNPTTGTLMLELTGGGFARIYNTTGQEVKSIEVTGKEISVDELATGLYHIIVETKQGLLHASFIKQ